MRTVRSASGRLGLQRVVVAGLLDRIWELRSNLNAYGATYVAVAETFGAPLVTADGRLAQAPGPRCTITSPLTDGGTATASTHRYSGPMVRQMTATDLKARLLAALDDVAQGDVIEITKHGRTIARLVPAQGPHALKGRLAEVAVTVADDDELFSTGARWDVE